MQRNAGRFLRCTSSKYYKPWFCFYDNHISTTYYLWLVAWKNPNWVMAAGMTNYYAKILSNYTLPFFLCKAILKSSSIAATLPTCAAASPTQTASHHSRTCWPTLCCVSSSGLFLPQPALATSLSSACARTFARRTSSTPCVSFPFAVSLSVLYWRRFHTMFQMCSYIHVTGRYGNFIAKGVWFPNEHGLNTCIL